MKPLIISLICTITFLQSYSQENTEKQSPIKTYGRKGGIPYNNYPEPSHWRNPVPKEESSINYSVVALSILGGSALLTVGYMIGRRSK